MPAGADSQCRECGYARSTTDWLEYQLDNGRMEPLNHPGEARHIATFGTTLETARDELRLYECSALACNDCARLCKHRTLIVPGRTWWRPGFTRAVLWIEIAILAALGIFEIVSGLERPSLVCPAIAVFFASLVVLYLLETHAQSVAWGNRRPRAPESCASCGGANLWIPTEVVQGHRYSDEKTPTDAPSNNRPLVCERGGAAAMLQTGDWLS
jgi:hypothetical protein